MQHRNLYLALFILLCSSNLLLSQRNKVVGNYLRIGGLISYSNSSQEYQISTSYNTVDNDVLLQFLTPTSGTFELEMDSVNITNSVNLTPPHNSLKFGMSLQLIKPNGFFQEFSLTNLSATEFSISNKRIIIHPDFENPVEIERSDKAKLFQCGLRYEVGSFLREMKAKKLNLGISLFLRPELEILRSIPGQFGIDPIKSSEFSTNIGIGMTVLSQISKRIFLEMKFYPSYELFNSKNVRLESPIYYQGRADFERVESSDRKNLEAMISVKYAIKVPHKKGRKMRF